MPSEDRVLEDSELRVTESGEQRVTESEVDNRVTISSILKYEIIGTSDIREVPTFKFDFPQEIYVVLE